MKHPPPASSPAEAKPTSPSPAIGAFRSGMGPLLGRVRDYAHELGIHALGIAPAEPPAKSDALLRWLRAGMAGDMRYLERDPQRRRNPRLYWPNARTLIVAAFSYAGPQADPPRPPHFGRIARYARGPDYHEPIKARLRRLGDLIRKDVPGSQNIAVSDSSAILERGHAAAAGLGWIAKNSMLLSRRLGSYTLLGVLLTDVDLETDGPTTSHCGSCTRCIDACPTRAIVEPGVVDARRCISYHTIELKGEIPEAFRPHLSGWLFGCDICQEVCPWVRSAKAPPEGFFHPQAEPGAIDLETILRDTPESFAERWRKRPQKRAKRRGLARTAATLLGNSPDRDEAVAVLARSGLTHDDALVRSHAVWSLGHLGGAKARRRLECHERRETDAGVLAAIRRAKARS